MKRFLETILQETKVQNTTNLSSIVEISKTIVENSTALAEMNELQELNQETSAKIIVRNEEIVIVSLVLFLWFSIIVLFVNKWGKIRMLEPYLPHLKLDTLPSPDTQPSRVSISIDPPPGSRRQSGNPHQQCAIIDITRRLSELSFASSSSFGRRKSEVVLSKFNKGLIFNHQHSLLSDRRKSDTGCSCTVSSEDFDAYIEETKEEDDQLQVLSSSVDPDKIQKQDSVNSDIQHSIPSTSAETRLPEFKQKLYKRRQSEYPTAMPHNKYSRRQSEACSLLSNKFSRRKSEAYLKFPIPTRHFSDFNPSSLSSTMYLNRMTGAGRFGRARQNSAFPGSYNFPTGSHTSCPENRTKSVDNLRTYLKNTRTTDV